MEVNKICKIHNLPIIFFEEKKDLQIQYLCEYCLQLQFKIKSLDQINENITTKLKYLGQKCQRNLSQLKGISVYLDEYKEQINSKLAKFTQLVEQQKQCLQNSGKQIENMLNAQTFQQVELLQEKENDLNKQFQEIKHQLQHQVTDTYTILKQETLLRMVDNFNLLPTFQQIIEMEQCKTINLEEIKLNYQLIAQSSIQYDQFCGAIAFNQDASLMIAGCAQFIKVFELKENQLKEIQQLDGHNNQVYCLLFMEQSSQFISASLDSTIIIWQLIDKNEFGMFQILDAHKQYIQCITINNKEDLLISGSADCTIIFWKKENDSWLLSQLIDCQCQSVIYSISLNNLQDKIIVSTNDKQVLVLQLFGKEWKICQRIQIEQNSMRLGFINKDQFVVQIFDQQHLSIYSYDLNVKAFKLNGEVKYPNKAKDNKTLFPIQYIPQIGLILVKNDEYVHIIKKTRNDQFIVEQSIHFGNFDIYGCASKDGKYIATWDVKSFQIQLRQLCI